MAGKKERQRRLARERYERQQARRLQRRRRQRQGAAIGGVVVLVAGLAVGGYFLFAFFQGKYIQATGPASHCSYTRSGAAARNVGTPPATPGAGLQSGSTQYMATIQTNRGKIVVNLAAGTATCAVNSFVYLAQKAFFNNTKCHRLTTKSIYVLQCGDPTGTGNGGPGYGFANEVSRDSTSTSATFAAGTLAMAHSSEPNSNGSQFFLVYRSTSLPRDYTPFGTVASGLDIVRNVAKAGTDNANASGDGHPKQSVVIESVSITS